MVSGPARRARCRESGGVGRVPRRRGLARCRALRRLAPLHRRLLHRRPLARASPPRPRRTASAARRRRADPRPAHQPQLASKPAPQPAPAGLATAPIPGRLRDGSRRRGLPSGEPRAPDRPDRADCADRADRADGRLRHRSLRSRCSLAAATFCSLAARAAARATATCACHRRTGRGATAFRGLTARVTRADRGRACGERGRGAPPPLLPAAPAAGNRRGADVDRRLWACARDPSWSYACSANAADAFATSAAAHRRGPASHLRCRASAQPRLYPTRHRPLAARRDGTAHC